MSTRTRPSKAQQEADFQAGFERLARLARVNFDMPAELRQPAATIWQVPMRRYGAEKWLHTLLMINEDGELENVGRYVCWVTGFKMVKNTYYVISRDPAGPVERLNREFEKAGYDSDWFRGFTL